MDPTSPNDVQIDPTAEQGTLDKSNVQKRIDEITAQKYAAEKAAADLQAQLAQTTAALAAQVAQSVTVKAAPEATLPEDASAAQVAKFFADKMDKQQREMQMRTEQMYMQMQNQLDQQSVAAKYSHLPEAVRVDAANRLTALKQRYGDAVNMEDAVAIAFYKNAMVAQQAGRQVAFNQMPQPISSMGAPILPIDSTTLASPASRADWDNLDNNTQVKLINEWEKKGGRLLT